MTPTYESMILLSKGKDPQIWEQHQVFSGGGIPQYISRTHGIISSQWLLPARTYIGIGSSVLVILGLELAKSFEDSWLEIPSRGRKQVQNGCGPKKRIAADQPEHIRLNNEKL